MCKSLFTYQRYLEQVGTTRLENSSAVNTSRINLFSTNVQTMLNVVSFLVSTLGILLCFVAASTTFPSILLTLDVTRHARQVKSEREREPNAHTILVITSGTTEFLSSNILTEQHVI